MKCFEVRHTPTAGGIGGANLDVHFEKACLPSADFPAFVVDECSLHPSAGS